MNAERLARYYAEDRQWWGTGQAYRLGPLAQAIGVGDVLDLGCGVGNLLSYLPAESRYLGVDLLEPHIREARNRWPGREFEVGDILTWEPAGSWDWVVMSTLFSGIGWDEADVPVAVARMARWARRGIALIDNVFLEATKAAVQTEADLRGWAVQELDGVDGYGVVARR